MPNLAATLKSEIARLARKEARNLTESLRKANAQYRRDVAELKRRVVAGAVALLFMSTVACHPDRPMVVDTAIGFVLSDPRVAAELGPLTRDEIHTVGTSVTTFPDSGTGWARVNFVVTTDPAHGLDVELTKEADDWQVRRVVLQTRGDRDVVIEPVADPKQGRTRPGEEQMGKVVEVRALGKS